VSSHFSRTTRSLASDTPALALVAWGCGALLLAVWFCWFFLSQVTVYALSRQARLEVQQSAHPVASTIASKVLVNRMTLGRDVRAGEVLLELDASAEQGHVREETSRLAGFAPRLASLQREIGTTRLLAADDQLSLRAAVAAARSRAEEAGVAEEFARESERRLREDHLAGGAAQIDALRAAADTRRLAAASDALAADVRRLESETSMRADQHQAHLEGLARALAQLQGEQATSATTLARLRDDVDRLTIRAPVAGVLGDVAPLGAGSFVALGQKLATVVPRGELAIVAEFSPALVLGRIRPGQHARLRLDGFPWAEYGTIDARVSRVATEIRDQQVRVEFTPEPAPGARAPLQHGLPGAIEVAIDHVSPATLVLRSIGQIGTDARPRAARPAAPQS
jgi:membrane fusion protein (multidrug efflux system)